MAMQRKRRRRSGGNNNNSTNPNKHFESNGPDVRIRGSAQQILEKYLQYARDAQTSGDRVKAEGLFQHAEHYARIVAEFERIKEAERIEREARDAARAEERAQQEAERAARAEAADSELEGAAETGEDADQAERRTRRPRRRRDSSEHEALKVIDAENTSETGPEETAENTELPKRRKYTRRVKETVEEDEGIMKTLSRGVEDEAVAELD